MSAGFRAIQWNRHKQVYDLLLVVGILLYLTGFSLLAPRLMPSDHPVTPEILRTRAFGSCGLTMLTLILAIGPLARLDRRFLPLLYNRRHFGVATCLVGLVHAWSAIDWYHGAGRLSALVSVLWSNGNYGSLVGFPFEALGLAALAILVVMAVTSHDFWLAFLTPPVWKAIHMAVYAAFGLLILHVALGVMQSERSPVIPVLLGAAVAVLGALHAVAGRRERMRDERPAGADAVGWLRVGMIDDLLANLPDGRARIVVPPDGERIAVFRNGATLSAIVNVCAHQNGPLGEGRIIDGCVTCPWHGFQFRPEDGCAPAPFTDKIATYRLKRDGETVLVDPRPLPPGTRVEPLALGALHG
ncbi:MAG TPA: Rieske 2Fe-2S domain-containing protein [Aliidongia sp.]|uniref:Rieske 2Fe-2S domain-containing protein n=1 Tax=Aliidongia sp. TaxID=1914230 RepID=UPI002DDD18F4|nr:Rieske 2Fe-2S domain-containing protein [Aliidongia sp.]HEV2674331.1 Rieske 2Fe-2S domain-containing protein [Aliidongia sp.]